MLYEREQSTLKITLIALTSCLGFFSLRYGDKTPKSLLARIYSAVWIIVGMVIFSVFTGEVASNLTSADVLPQNSAFGKQV